MALQVDRINGLVGDLGVKAPVRAASTANLTLSGLQTIDGVTVVAGDRVLVKDQTTTSENGIYSSEVGAWAREPDFDGPRDIAKGTQVVVAEGTTQGGFVFRVDSTAPTTIGTDTITFTRVGVSDLALTGVTSAEHLVVGDQGTEGAGINIGGVTYESTFKVSDINGTNFAQTILHRHSTILEPLIVGARSNSDTTAHTAVVNGQGLLSLFAAGSAGSNYKLFGQAQFAVDDTGTISNTSAPGKWTLLLTPDGSTTPVARLTIRNNGTSIFNSTGSLGIPSGTTAQRDGTPADGYFRFNSTLTALETWYSSAWNTIATTANAVLTSGNQTIAGVKTFSSPVGVAAATASGDAVRLEASGTFNWNCSEFTVAQDYAVNYYKIGKVAFITPTGAGITGTSNSVNKTLTGLPAALRPVVDIIVKLSARDNGGALVSAAMTITTAGVVTIYSSENGTAFTASGICKLVIPPTSWVTA